MRQFRRGFKSWAEAKSVDLRRALQLRPEATLPMIKLAEHLQTDVIGPAEIPGVSPELLHQLLMTGRSDWSAVTLQLPGRTVIIQNIAHSPARQRSDITHELAHGICGHKAEQIVVLPGFPFPMRDFDDAQEDEATWLSGCLLLPRQALLWAARRGMTDDEVCDHFGTSVDLTRFRRKMTGIDKQLEATMRTRCDR